MARGKKGKRKKDVEDKIIGAGIVSGGFLGVSMGIIGDSMASNAEAAMMGAGGLATFFGLSYAGIRASDELSGRATKAVDRYAGRDSVELHLDWHDPLEVEESSNINGFEGEFEEGPSGTFKYSYFNDDGVFIQAPKRGHTFDQALQRVQTWKENAEALDEADEYLEDILEKEGTTTVEDARGIEVDYEYLKENADTLRQDVEGGILTPGESYDIVVTSHNGEPLPVLVSDFNENAAESTSNPENGEEVVERQKVLGMYMDALIAEGVFEGTPGDFWETEGRGRHKTKNMFYDPNKDQVGVTDLGEGIAEWIETPDDIGVGYGRDPAIEKLWEYGRALQPDFI